mgnify:CR=1 FL=1
MSLLRLEDLSKLYPVGGGRRLHAVDGVNFQIQPGESLGLVGESGCGKSTLVRLITRLIDPSGGKILFDGVDIGAIPAARFGRSPHRGEIQVVFQDPHDSLNPRFTAFDVIADPLKRIQKLRGQALRTRVETVAGEVGLPGELLTRYPHQLSGGQKARVNIGRALAVNPRLLILDEPTSALDVSVQAVILKLLDRLRREHNIGYLFVSHDLNVVRLLCDRVLVMYLGKLAEVGEAHEVFDRPRHPYTQALISAIPSYDPEAQRERLRLDGEPRSPIDPSPTVCRFHGRCFRGDGRCQEEAPALREIDPGHWTACHHAGSGPRALVTDRAVLDPPPASPLSQAR